MAFKFLDRARMTTATTGTGTMTLGSAVAGYQSFASAGIANADTVHYVIEDGTAWEIGLGTYTSAGTTLARTTRLSSSTGALISLSGTAEVFASLVSAAIGTGANDLLLLDSAGKIPAVDGSQITGLPAVPAAATAAEIRSNTGSGKYADPPTSWSALAWVSLTDAATVTPNMNNGINFTWTIGGNRTLAFPTNAIAGSSFSIEITQDGTGSRILTLGAGYHTAGGVDFVLSTAAGSVDVLSGVFKSTTVAHCSFIRGSA